MWLLTLAFFIYAGYRRIQLRKRFALPGSDANDYAAWLLLPCCALSQETRTLAFNRVENGAWQGPLQVTTPGGMRPTGYSYAPQNGLGTPQPQYAPQWAQPQHFSATVPQWAGQPLPTAAPVPVAQAVPLH